MDDGNSKIMNWMTSPHSTLNPLISLSMVFATIYIISLMPGLGWLLAIALLIIVFHEYGHYYATKMYNIIPLDFSVGFGPILFSRKTSFGTKVNLRLLLLGGFVNPGDLDRLSHGKRIVILAAGPFANILSAFIAAIVLNYRRGWGIWELIPQSFNTIQDLLFSVITEIGNALISPVVVINKLIQGEPSALRVDEGINVLNSNLTTQPNTFEYLLSLFIVFSMLIGLFQLVPIYGTDGYQIIDQTVKKVKRSTKITTKPAKQFSSVYRTLTFGYVFVLMITQVIAGYFS